MNAFILDNVYRLMINVEKIYDRISREGRKLLISSLIKEIQKYLCDKAEISLKPISFNLPVYKEGKAVQEFLRDKGSAAESIEVWASNYEFL